jgi:hypothetical protein
MRHERSTERPIEDDERVSLIVDFAFAILVYATPPESEQESIWQSGQASVVRSRAP